jgi:UDP-N-acetylglucosamine 4-epimerase
MRWPVTGAAGFVGSHLVETLLGLDQWVTGFDNLSTGKSGNLDDVRAIVGDSCWERFSFVEGDMRDPTSCALACKGADYLLHQAALGSVPRSIADPATSTAVNIGGFVNMLVAAREAGVGRTVYASSSSVYGDHPGLPKV